MAENTTTPDEFTGPLPKKIHPSNKKPFEPPEDTGDLHPDLKKYIKINPIVLDPDQELVSLTKQGERLSNRISRLMTVRQNLLNKVEEINRGIQVATYTPSPAEYNYVNMVLRDCSDVIDVIKKTHFFLYRGLGDANPRDVFLGRTRVDRKPKDMHKKLHTAIDDILTQAGFNATRSNSIFVTGLKSHASAYGRLYMIFPLNGFDFTWSPLYADLYSDINGSSSYKIFPLMANKPLDVSTHLEKKIIKILQATYQRLDPNNTGTDKSQDAANFAGLCKRFVNQDTYHLPDNIRHMNSMLEELISKIEDLPASIDNFSELETCVYNLILLNQWKK